MEVVQLNGQVRTDLGKKATKAIRNEGRIPCVVYGGDEAVHFSITQKEVRDLVYTPDFKLAEIVVDGQTHKAILKDIQFHPVTDNIRHVDFLRLVDGHPLKVDIPVRFKGVSPGVKNGGKLQQNLRRVRVKTVPEHLVSELYIDISNLALGDAARVRDLEVDEDKIEVMSPGATPVAVVETPRALRSAATAAAKAAEEGGEAPAEEEATQE